MLLPPGSLPVYLYHSEALVVPRLLPVNDDLLITSVLALAWSPSQTVGSALGAEDG